MAGNLENSQTGNELDYIILSNGWASQLLLISYG